MSKAALQQAQLALTLPPSPVEIPAAAPQLWCCVYFAQLPLEIVAQNSAYDAIVTEQRPLAISQEVNGRPQIQSVSRSAKEAGVRPGLTLAAALALCPDLNLTPRQPELEQQVLRQLAHWSDQFTPWASLDFDQALLLEVKSSLRLFGSLEALIQRLQDGCQQRGYRPCIAVTPSPRASWLLARAGLAVNITQTEALRGTLGRLPLSTLDLPVRTLQRLHKTGLNQLRDLWRLPRPDLGRRYGQALLQTLDHISAQRVEILSEFEHPLTFSAEQELPIAMDSWTRFWPQLGHLLQTLVEFLRTRNAALSSFQLSFYHARHSESRLSIGLRCPSQSLEHLSLLVREQLGQYALSASVIGLKISTRSMQPYCAHAQDLFGDSLASETDESWQNLLDQLQARMGPNSVQQLGIRADHRPELAQQFIQNNHRVVSSRSKKKPQEKAANSPERLPEKNRSRPLWLLPEPQPLNRKHYRIESPLERIESGWWDPQAVRRDYGIAVDRYGSRWWVFRELSQPECWYLHGSFG